MHKNPQENRVSCYYVDFQDEQYIVPIHHTEKYQDNIELIETEQTIFVQDLKQYYHNTLVFGKDIRDMNWSYYLQHNKSYESEQHLTSAHHYYRIHYDKQNINDINSIVKHTEYLKPIKKIYFIIIKKQDQTLLENLSNRTKWIKNLRKR